MNITVIVCTYNRCRSFVRTLNSISLSVLPQSVAWEVLLVDNNSTDATRAMFEEFRSRTHRDCFRYVFEPRQGLSFARNAGIREGLGDIIAFTDDDAVVDRGWLWNLTTYIRSGECAGVGGRTLPDGPFSLPRWLSQQEPYNWGGILGGFFDLGDQPCELVGLAPFGNNMAYSKKSFEKYGEFRTKLGRRPGSLMSNEDTEFGRRLIAQGERLRYDPRAIVYHPVLEERLNRKYFLRWQFDYGRALILEEGNPDGLKIGLKFLARTLRWIMSVGVAKRFQRKCNVWAMAGKISETWRQGYERPESSASRDHVERRTN